MDEKSVLRSVLRGDEAALGLVIDRYAAYVSAIIRNILGGRMSEADVEETAADVFCILWQNAAQIKPGKLRAYLGAVARNKAKTKLRAQSETLSLEDDEIELTCPSPESEAEQRELSRRVREAVLSLPADDREIFLRYYYYYEPVTQIAEALGMNLSTVKTRLRRGREKLKNTLNERGVLDGDENFGASELPDR